MHRCYPCYEEIRTTDADALLLEFVKRILLSRTRSKTHLVLALEYRAVDSYTHFEACCHIHIIIHKLYYVASSMIRNSVPYISYHLRPMCYSNITKRSWSTMVGQHNASDRQAQRSLAHSLTQCIQTCAVITCCSGSG